MRAVLALVLALVPLGTGCGGQQQPVQAPSRSATSVPSAAASESRPRVDSALCDDLREVVAVRAGDGELTSQTARQAAAGAVRAAARRVLVQLGAPPPAPEDVVAALRELEGGAGPDDGLDATVAAFVDQECGGS